MVLLNKLCVKALYACPNCKTGPRHTPVCVVKGYQVDLGKIVEESILEYSKGNFAGNIPHPSLITLLCIKGVVKFNGGEVSQDLTSNSYWSPQSSSGD